ncbi:XK-related protein 9 isoform X1 [Hippoglossus hippoglossus]|uniref:XK-related protein 9 isoform X1 n=1 Tax=Hippoglossus hippoglossus TaxID=8267 RepID=UPI00148C064A|nr:XK-related protein 9 isoform X1 [Hippoglossus hippoglossus]XP_034428454.1 XK-related protein 9 isoform X1 [Hippoglossus hippoglossus]XP_034428456.1 XK-related protein 9 isoform X1 [Hippoglossus hippoglossus]XP_034428457.1 XK-related protein 9 isoform X1 [Hippoglossus hippoglossus]
MLDSDSQYTRLRWLLTIVGLVLYVVDIGTDVGLALRHFGEKQYVWAGLTLLFVLAGLLVSQIFSFAWYRDDMKDGLTNPDGRGTVAGMSTGELVVLHIFGMGVVSRYYHLLKKGFKVVRMTPMCSTVEERREEHHSLFCVAADLSMLKLFEAFLESAPQLLLQLYILLDHCKGSVMQYLSMVFSFFNIAWALVDYRRCLRRSLPLIREMPSGLPTAIYLLYKLCTITSHILSYSLLLLLSSYSTVALVLLWLLMTTFTHLLHTNFCSSKSLELLYQAVVGVILTFTFFNVKGQDTKVLMTIYYIFHVLINVTAPVLLALLKPEQQTGPFLLPVGCLIVVGSVLGLGGLILYYAYLHPRGKWREADEVDGLGNETESMRRMRNFLHP